MNHLKKRGPDGNGIWVSRENDVGLVHTRLSVIDLHERANQPMVLENEGFVISFNGEIYNYQTLRKELQREGYQFRTTSDTEVLLYLYLKYKEDMLDHIRGMFAFTIWDPHADALFCARDPYGIKPLYYSDDGKILRVASQVKTIGVSGAVSNENDPAGVVGFYLFGHIPEPHTLYMDIRALPAGCYMYAAKGETPKIHRYISVASIYRTSEPMHITEEENLEAMREALIDSVIGHSVSDVPVGLFLSSGIDSCVLLGLMSQSYEREIKTVTLGFEEYSGKEDDELPLANEIARLCGSHHVATRVSVDDVKSNLPLFFDAMDQPSIDGLNTWLVSGAVAGQGLKVALSGVGGDELFGGYPSFGDIPRWHKFMRRIGKIPYITGATRQTLRALYAIGIPLNPKLRGLPEFATSLSGAYLVKRGLFMPWELDGLLERDFCETGLEMLAPLDSIESVITPDPGTDRSRIATLESCLYMKNQLLRDTDWAAMDHSLEVRTPLVDINLLRTLAPLSNIENGPQTKSLFAQVPLQKFPQSWQLREKTGFTVPIANWLESTDGLDVWKRVSKLRLPRCHWSRRWAYTVMSNALENA